jgi:diguanylate cyclase (GGDEF)-like protein
VYHLKSVVEVIDCEQEEISTLRNETFPSFEMTGPAPTLFANEADADVLEKLVVAERVALGAVIALAILNLACSLLPPAQQLMAANWRPMGAQAVLFTLMSALSLLLLEPRRSQRSEWTGWALAAAILLLSGLIVAGRVLHPALGAAPVSSALRPFWISNARISVQTASGFAALGLAMMFLRARSRAAVVAADLATCLPLLVVLVSASEQIIDMLHVFGPAVDTDRAFQSMVCLLLLTAVTICRRARKGVFSIFLGRGTGSRMARVLSPILLIFPYLRECGRAYFIGDSRMPPPYATAVLATLAVLVAGSLLLYLAWRINSMEAQIHTLSVRDELTGLYNLRGFRLLTEQALRVANRSRHPFSVLFLDLDDLKQVNDQFGHFVGSQCLVDIAKILRAAFREADVLGRIGGDEFAVAGEFTEQGMLLAAGRLEEAVTRWNAEPDRPIPLNLSFGTVTSQTVPHESLDALLKNADHAMYENKRRKKSLAGEIVRS